MLNRRILRTKVLQALYAYFQSEDERIDVAEKNLLSSINNIYVLYIYQLSMIIELVDFIKHRNEENKQKHLPTEEDLNPSTKIIDNIIIKQISENKYFRLKYNEYKISWIDEQEMFRQIYNTMKESNTYAKYIRSVESFPFEADKKFVLRIFRKFIVDNENVYNYFEDKNIHWSDDFFDVAFMVIRTIEEFTSETNENDPLPDLFRRDERSNPEDDIHFIKHLFRKTIIHSKEFEEMISKKASNWESDRIAVIDMIILKMALTEIIEFPTIPVKVTMNEYIDISKEYSSEKSRVFINGIIDKMAQDLDEDHKINKIAISYNKEQNKFTK